MKENVSLIKSLLLLINKSSKNSSVETKKREIQEKLDNRTLYLTDGANPLQLLLNNFIYQKLVEVLTDADSINELVDILNKFNNNMLVDDTGVKREKKLRGFDLDGKPIYEENEVEGIGNISLKNGEEFNSTLNTTGNPNYDKYLDELNKWSKGNNMKITKDTSLSAFCHILNIFQKSLKLTQPDENASKIYNNYRMRILNETKSK